MSSVLPSYTSKKLIRFFKKQGWREDRQRGSHLSLVNPDGSKTITIPVHSGTDIGKGLFKRILNDAEISVEEFNRLR